MGVNKSNPDQYQLRFPPGLRERIKKYAKASGRTLNSEIISTLEKAYPDEYQQLHDAIDEIRAAIDKAPEPIRKQLQEKLDSITQGIFF